MPQLYGKTPNAADDEEDPQVLNSGSVGSGGQAQQGPGQQAANSAYANFEDIYNENRNYGKRAENQTLNDFNNTLGPAYKGLAGKANQVQSETPGRVLPQNITASAGSITPPTANLTGMQQMADVQNGKAQPAPERGRSRDTSKNPQGQTGSPLLQGFGPNAPNVPNNVGPPIPNNSNVHPLNHVGSAGTPTGLNAKPQGVNVGTLAPPSADAPPATPGPQAMLAQAPVTAQQQTPAPGTDQTNITNGQNALDKATQDDATKTQREQAQLGRDTAAAQQLSAFKDDGGLSQLQTHDPNATAYDAAIMDQAGARSAFAPLEKQYGASNPAGSIDQQYAAKAGADQKARADNINALKTQQGLFQQTADARANQAAAQQIGQTQTAGAQQDQKPLDPYAGGESLQDIIGMNWDDYLRQAGGGLSPVDNIWNQIPGAGKSPESMSTNYLEGSGTSSGGSGMYGSSKLGNDTSDEDTKIAFGNFAKDYPGFAKALWASIPASMQNSWRTDKGMNQHDIYAVMQQQLQENLSRPPGTPGSNKRFWDEMNGQDVWSPDYKGGA